MSSHEKVTVILCPRPDPKCGTKKVPQCPTLEIGDDGILIKDDFGGAVHLTRKQFDMLIEHGSRLVR